MTAVILIAVALGCERWSGTDTLVRSDNPLDRLDASAKLSVQLPATAKDIYFVEHSRGTQEYELFLRFGVDPGSLDEAVNFMIAEHDRTTQQHLASQTVLIKDAPDSPDCKGFSPMTWWTPKNFVNGYYRGATNNGDFHIWVDSERNVVFLCETD